MMITINKPKDQPEVSIYDVVKNRFSGETGVACGVKYNKKTGRLTEMNDVTGFDIEGDY